MRVVFNFLQVQIPSAIDMDKNLKRQFFDSKTWFQIHFHLKIAKNHLYNLKKLIPKAKNNPNCLKTRILHQPQSTFSSDIQSKKHFNNTIFVKINTLTSCLATFVKKIRPTIFLFSLSLSSKSLSPLLILSQDEILKSEKKKKWNFELKCKIFIKINLDEYAESITRILDGLSSKLDLISVHTSNYLNWWEKSENRINILTMTTLQKHKMGIFFFVYFTP